MCEEKFEELLSIKKIYSDIFDIIQSESCPHVYGLISTKKYCYSGCGYDEHLKCWRAAIFLARQRKTTKE